MSRPDVQILRPGAAFVDALETYLDWDDRGTAFVTWRMIPDGPERGRERLILKLCWIVEPALSETRDLLAGEDPSGLRKRAFSHLPPRTFVQHLDESLCRWRILACWRSSSGPAGSLRTTLEGGTSTLAADRNGCRRCCARTSSPTFAHAHAP